VALTAAIREYLVRGTERGASPYELRELFDGSRPSLPEQAGLTASQQQLASRTFDRVSAGMFGVRAAPPRAGSRAGAAPWLLGANAVIAAGVGAFAGWDHGLAALFGLPVLALGLFVLFGPLGGPPAHQENMLRNPDRQPRRP
jgi:hypothetical protein